jgi:hypothetical protein
LADPPVNTDPEYKSAQLAKLKAETEKLLAEKQKLEQEAATLPKQAKGSYWSELIKILGAIVLGIGGVVTAGGSYFVARNQVELAEIKSSIAVEKAKAAEAAVEIALRNRDAARKEEAEAARSAQELRDSLAALTTRVQASKPELVQRKLVYIQFQGSLARSIVNDLRSSLEAQIFTAPGAERLSGDYPSQVKFFRPEDEQVANLLAKSSEDFFAARGCPLKLRVTSARAGSAAPPLELWLAHSCSQR